ncbi:MAG: response regulator [Candidatus Symbiothrix sp.]|jgi:signal transduction histidine kinase/CheY-like chemotaxis protein|nr:response regulator [Candidatus Symbiothrix sp.]
MLRTKILIIISYVILSITFIVGIGWIYREWANYNKEIEPYSEPNELVALSTTLSSLYRASGTVGLLSLVDDKHLKQEYDSMMLSVFTQIDSMRKVSFASNWRHHLDTLEVLIKRKQQNTDELAALSQQFSTLTSQRISKATVLNKHDVKALDKILNNCNPAQTNNDTNVVVKQKGSLFRRIGEAIRNSGPDTVQNITNSSSIIYQQEVTLPILRDTIVEFIREMNYTVQKRNAQVTAGMIAKQNELYRINEKTTMQINQLISLLQADNYRRHIEAAAARETALQNSARMMAIFALIAGILVLIFMAWVLRSLAQNQNLHNEIEARKKHTENLLISRERLMLMISHDIKAPISSILGYLELMKRDIFSDEYTAYIRNMRHSAIHILDLVRNLLEFHSLEKTQQKKDVLRFSPYLLLTEIYQSFIPEAFKKEIQYDFQSNIDAKESYISDPYRIRQIINNLISNAIKFTPKRGEILLSAQLDKKNDPILLVISVKDTGSGIKEADIHRVFDEFQRLDYSENSVEGVGLGLHIANRLAKILSGTIFVESEVDKGSTFTLTLPVDKIGNIPEHATLAKNNSIKRPIRVLFIDDDLIQLDMVSRLMEREGMPSRACSSATEALTLLTKEHFDIIFSDVNMPELNGVELVKQIRLAEFKDSMTIPIVGLSGAHMSEKECKESGFAAFVEKPFTAEQLMSAIYEHTGNKYMGFEAFIRFAGEDAAAGKSIISTFVAETEKNYNLLRQAFNTDDWETIKNISHKMLPLMKMISSGTLVDLLQDYANGNQSKDNKELLLELIWKSICEANQYL